MKLPLILSAACLLASTAHAAEKRLPLFYCTPAQAVSAQALFCEENDAFITQGENCITKLENEIKASTAAMTGAFSKNLDQKQDKKFNSSLQDHAVSSATLAYLISLTDVAMADVKGYQGTINLPEDTDEPETTGMDPQSYAMKSECYGDTLSSLQSIVADINQMKNELIAAKKIADANAATSDTREQQVQVNSGGNIIKGGQAKPSAPVTGNPKNRDSDVTGIEESKKKNEQKK